MRFSEFKIEDVFIITGRGIVLSGEILSGKINTGDYINIGLNPFLIIGIESFRKGGSGVSSRVGILIRTSDTNKSFPEIKEDLKQYNNTIASITTFDSLLPPSINTEELKYKYSTFNKDKSEQHIKYLQEEGLKAQLFCNSVLGMRPDIGFYIEVNGITISKDVFPKEYEQIVKAWSKVHEKLNEFKNKDNAE